MNDSERVTFFVKFILVYKIKLTHRKFRSGNNKFGNAITFNEMKIYQIIILHNKIWGMEKYGT